MSDLAIQQVLAQMRQMKVEASAPGQQPAEVDGPAFAELLQRSIETVNDLQQSSGEMRTAFARGDADVSLAEVMVAGQKSRIAFEAMVQVRNRLVEAYQEIQRMQI